MRANYVFNVSEIGERICGSLDCHHPEGFSQIFRGLRGHLIAHFPTCPRHSLQYHGYRGTAKIACAGSLCRAVGSKFILGGLKSSAHSKIVMALLGGPGEIFEM